jgi:hypothetical protein
LRQLERRHLNTVPEYLGYYVLGYVRHLLLRENGCIFAMPVVWQGEVMVDIVAEHKQ